MDEEVIYHRIKTVAAMTGITERRIRLYEKQADSPIARVSRGGNIEVRMFSPEDIFNIAAHKRQIGEGEALPRPLTASVYLPKGGVGKSTLATELSVLWSLMGLRVLVIDADPQGSTTVIYGYEPEASDADYQDYDLRPQDVIHHTFANLVDFTDMTGAQPPVALSKVIKKPFGENGPHLVPADVTLAGIFYMLDRATNRDRKIEQWIRIGRERPTAELDLRSYDVILFDNAPATSTLSRATLVASDFAISPVRLDALSAKSLSFISQELVSLDKANLPIPQLLVVPTFYSPSSSRPDQIMKGLWQNYAQSMMSGVQIRSSEAFPKGLMKLKPRQRAPISLQQPGHKVVLEDLKGTASAILERFKKVDVDG